MTLKDDVEHMDALRNILLKLRSGTKITPDLAQSIADIIEESETLIQSQKQIIRDLSGIAQMLKDVIRDYLRKNV